MKFSIVFILMVCLSFGFLDFSSDAAIDPETIVGAWLFDEGSGNVAGDMSGNALDGTVQGDANWVDGQFGKALELDGSGAYVEVPGHENPRDAITVSLWVKSKTETWNQHGWFVEKRNAYILHPNIDTKVMAWAVCNGGCWNKPGGWNDQSTGPDDITQWHLYTTTFDSATGKWIIYIDAEIASEMDIDQTPLDADTGPVFIGRDTCCAGRFGNALIDEVAIFSVALEQSDIESLMNDGFEQTLTAVEAEGKMATTWGNVKQRY
ncbi:MAG: LamG domain-containing protein [Candidatus Poribacteria bacterium]|nr:LamG domain-containing protein [Candidatus Poribacteria bacterium]